MLRGTARCAETHNGINSVLSSPARSSFMLLMRSWLIALRMNVSAYCLMLSQISSGVGPLGLEPNKISPITFCGRDACIIWEQDWFGTLAGCVCAQASEQPTPPQFCRASITEGHMQTCHAPIMHWQTRASIQAAAALARTMISPPRTPPTAARHNSGDKLSSRDVCVIIACMHCRVAHSPSPSPGPRAACLFSSLLSYLFRDGAQDAGADSVTI